MPAQSNGALHIAFGGNPNAIVRQTSPQSSLNTESHHDLWTAAEHDRVLRVKRVQPLEQQGHDAHIARPVRSRPINGGLDIKSSVRPHLQLIRVKNRIRRSRAEQ